MNTQRLIGPTIEPVTVAELKASPALRIDGALDDAYLAALISAARLECEQNTGRTLLSTTWETVLSAFPAAGLPLPWPNVQSVVHVKYTSAGLQTLAPSAYALDASKLPPHLAPTSGNTWPATETAANAVQIRYTAGFDDPLASEAERRASVPASLRCWVLLRAAQLYMGCDGGEAAAMANHPLLWPFKVYP